MYTNGHEEKFDSRYLELIMNQDGFIATFIKERRNVELQVIQVINAGQRGTSFYKVLTRSQLQNIPVTLVR